MRSKTSEIIDKQIASEILEIKLDKAYSLNDLLESLFFNGYNNWREDNVTKVAYYQLGDVYIFKNNNVNK